MSSDRESVFEGNPDHAHLVAEITSEWALLEFELSLLLACVTRMDAHTAGALYYTVSSNKVRREMILNGARAEIADDELIQSIERLLSRAQRAAAKRNDLIHGLWHMPFGPGVSSIALVTKHDGGQQHRVSTKALKQTLDQIIKLNDDVRAMVWDNSIWQALPEKSRALPPPPREWGTRNRPRSRGKRQPPPRSSGA